MKTFQAVGTGVIGFDPCQSHVRDFIKTMHTELPRRRANGTLDGHHFTLEELLSALDEATNLGAETPLAIGLHDAEAARSRLSARSSSHSQAQYAGTNPTRRQRPGRPPSQQPNT